MAGGRPGVQSVGMKPEHTPPHDPLRNDPPCLGPVPTVRHDIGQDISGMRTQTWEPRPRKRAQWPFWVAGLAVLGVVAAMMFDMKPDQWVSAHLDRPAPASETVPLPLPSQPAPQAQTDVPPLPPLAQAPTAAAPATPGAESTRSRPDQTARERSTTVAQAALQPRAEAQPTPEPAAAPAEPPPAPASPRPVPVDPAAPSSGRTGD